MLMLQLKVLLAIAVIAALASPLRTDSNPPVSTGPEAVMPATQGSAIHPRSHGGPVVDAICALVPICGD